MKKLITLLLAVAGCVGTASADLYLNNYNDNWNAYPAFTYNSTEGCYEYVLNSTTGLNDDDFFFVLKWSDQSFYLRPYNSYGNSNDYTFVFDETTSTNETELQCGSWQSYTVKYNDDYKRGGAFIIPHATIGAKEYKITAYTGSEVTIKVEIIDMPVSVTSAGYATFSCDRALDLSGLEAKGIKAYTASGSDASSVTMTKQESYVPANTGLFLQSTSGAAVNTTIPVVTTATASGWSGTNYLEPSTAADVPAGNYIFAKQGENVGFYLLASATNIGAGKAYLSSSKLGGGSRLSIVFADGATGIQAVSQSETNGEAFNLAGQRVSNPTKGLYIVNGKKVIIK